MSTLLDLGCRVLIQGLVETAHPTNYYISGSVLLVSLSLHLASMYRAFVKTTFQPLANFSVRIRSLFQLVSPRWRSPWFCFWPFSTDIWNPHPSQLSYVTIFHHPILFNGCLEFTNITGNTCLLWNMSYIEKWQNVPAWVEYLPGMFLKCLGEPYIKF